MISTATSWRSIQIDVSLTIINFYQRTVRDQIIP